ncbi:MAG: methyltransferase [Pirellulaceae bacterium]|nr:methyltransferase [Pirellulaceae bacterium]
MPDAEYLRLLVRIQRQFPTLSEELVFGDRRLTFTRVADPDQVLQQMERRPDQPWQPYWAEVWTSGLLLAERCAGLKLAGQRVLDLGCGLGLVGAVALASGAHVVLADAAPPALLFARLNGWPWRQRASCRRLDWRRDWLRPLKFDLILGADILYDPAEWSYLEQFWRRHLREQGEVWLGEPGRSTGEEFAGWLQARGWQVASEMTMAPGGQPSRLLSARILPPGFGRDYH